MASGESPIPPSPTPISTPIIALNLSQTPNQSCSTCLRALARVYCDACRLYDDKRGKSVTHCSKCSICRQGIPSLLTHCMKCDVCYNKRTLRSWFAEGKSGNVHLRSNMISARCGRIYASLNITYPNDFDFTLTKGVQDEELLNVINERDSKIIQKLAFWDYSWLPATVIEKLFLQCPFTPPSSRRMSRASSSNMTNDSKKDSRVGKIHLDGDISISINVVDDYTSGVVITRESTAGNSQTNIARQTTTTRRRTGVSFTDDDHPRPTDITIVHNHNSYGSNQEENINVIDINRRLKLVDYETYSAEFKKEMILKYYPNIGLRQDENSFYSIIKSYRETQHNLNPRLSLPNQNELCFPKVPLMNHKETHPIYNPILRIRAQVGSTPLPDTNKPSISIQSNDNTNDQPIHHDSNNNNQSFLSSFLTSSIFSPNNPNPNDKNADRGGLPMLLPTTLTADIQQRFVETDDDLTYPHICITSIMTTSCFICLQPLSQGNATISTLSCSHVLHSQCLKSFLQNNGTKCFCRRSISANPLYSQQIEAYLRADPQGIMNNPAVITCNDCDISFQIDQHHLTFNRCLNCTSFNTFISSVLPPVVRSGTTIASTALNTGFSLTDNLNNDNNNDNNIATQSQMADIDLTTDSDSSSSSDYD
jgi:hypothetical protein